MNLKKLLSEQRTATVQSKLPKTINNAIEAYQKAYANRFPNEAKRRKSDLIMYMMLIGLKAFKSETRLMKFQFNNYNKSK